MSTSITETHFLTAATTTELEDWGGLPEATAEAMQTSGVVVWEDREQQAGVWECTPGPSRWVMTSNEFIYVLYGRMTVIPDDGEPTEIGPGDTMVFPKGWSGNWQIHENVRKLYVLF
ncbi:MAG: cupin domain-containing protein [Streptosporangiaceae bacterium]